MYMCIVHAYVYMQECVCMYLCGWIQIYTGTCVWAPPWSQLPTAWMKWGVALYAYMHVCIYILYICMYICMWVFMYVCVQLQIYFNMCERAPSRSQLSPALTKWHDMTCACGMHRHKHAPKNPHTYQKRPTNQTRIQKRMWIPMNSYLKRLIKTQPKETYKRDLRRETYKSNLHPEAHVGTKKQLSKETYKAQNKTKDSKENYLKNSTQSDRNLQKWHSPLTKQTFISSACDYQEITLKRDR